MREKINFHMCLVGVVSILLTTALVLWAFFGFYRSQMQKSIRTQTALAAGVYEAGGGMDTLAQRAAALRLTLIAADGSVLFDSQADMAMENHLNRPEVAQALREGVGEDTRHSATLGENTYYYALRLKDGTVLRVAEDTGSIFSMYANVIPVVVIISFAMLALCVFVSSMATRRIIAPINRLAAHMDTAKSYPVYEELEPFLYRINSQKQRILEQLRNIQEEKDRISLIMSNMEEGLLLLDAQKKVLMVNPSARDLLHTGGCDCVGRDVLYFYRDPQFLQAVEQGSQGESRDVTLYLEGRYLQVFVNPVWEQARLTGVIVLLVDVTDREKAEKMRREFSANVSHELKTPLTSISGYGELIASGIARQEDVGGFAEKIEKEAHRLILLINDIIRLSDLDDISALRNFQNVDLLACARDAVKSLEFAAGQKQVTLTVEGESVWISADKGMVEELVYNLCDNAIRYNRQGGSVEVTVSRAGQLMVRDTGIGIPAEARQRVFERFYRVDKSRSKQSGGTGLGLSIVKHIAQAHRAKISLYSEEGQGTSVSVAFPVADKPVSKG